MPKQLINKGCSKNKNKFVFIIKISKWNNKYGFLLTFLFNLSFQLLMSQGETTYWYFGDCAGISFANGDPIVLTDGALSTWEGCSSISTTSGSLCFYTDGITVWNRDHQVMPHGSGLLGDPSSSQSGIIVPKPGSDQLYYIFSVDDVDPTGGVNGLHYTLVDMNLDNLKGDIVTNEKNISVNHPICEKVTAVRHKNGTDIWIIIQKFGTNNFYSYKVTADGVDLTPVLSTAGIVIGGPPPYPNIDVAKGYMKVSPDGSRLAKANAGLRSVEIFDFNDSTGIVNNGIIDTNIGGEPYGIEFSPNSKLLYVTTWKSNPGQHLYQYNLIAEDIIGSRVEIATGLNGSLQLAPDNRIYAAMGQFGYYLSRINQPNKSGSDCEFQYNAIYLEGRNGMWGLPNFIAFEVDTTVGVNERNIYNKNYLQVYFDPTSNNLVLSLNKLPSGQKRILIFNQLGQIRNDLYSCEERQVINTTSWSKGLYVAVIFLENKILTRRKILIN